MYSDLFSASSVQDLMAVLPSLPYAIWETFYVTVLSTLLSLVLGLPLGVLLVAGEKNGVLPLPRWLLQVLNVIINLLRSVPFLILMIMVFPLSRLIIGTAVGTTATIVPLVVAAFPFVAQDPIKWRGQNLLGFALMEVRDELRRVTQNEMLCDWSMVWEQ